MNAWRAASLATQFGATVVGWQADNTGQWRPCFWRYNGTSWGQTRPAAPGGAGGFLPWRFR